MQIEKYNVKYNFKPLLRVCKSELYLEYKTFKILTVDLYILLYKI